MKITKILLWIAYISFGLSITAFTFFGIIFLKKDFNTQQVEKSNLKGVIDKSTTGKFELPMNLNVEYYFRVKNGEVLLDSYFLKIQKKFLTSTLLPQGEKKEIDYPKKLTGNIYSMPESDMYLYIPIPFSSIETTLTIWKVYFSLAFLFLLIAIFLAIKFLQNCNKSQFFIPANSTYIRVISYLAFVYCLISYGSQWLIFKTLNHNLEGFSPIDLNAAVKFNWNYLIFSLFLVLIAQAFSEGIKLKEEQSLTI
ncbi:DUF2975 domain-containing protein [Algoriphagus sp.]|uniref:DUF2975 domain-containing protein n=1 Tax=Algoriphagus sp. TaxID=1872435 RepID=UPI0039189B78